MKNRMKQKLERELGGVHVSSGLKQRILAEAAASREPSRRRNSFSMRPLAIAAAVMVTFGLTAGMIALRTEKPDLSTTPLASTQNDQKVVWAGEDSLYHGASICGDQQNMEKMTPEQARAEGRKACSACIDKNSAIADDLVWMNNFSGYYHEDKDCSDLEGAIGVLKMEAEILGREACPVCAGGAYPTPSPIPWVSASPAPVETLQPEQMLQPTPKPAEAFVWMTGDGVFCHAEEHCSGMEGAIQVPLKDAMLMEKTLCPDCMERTVWIDEGQGNWHLAKNCSGMEKAKKMILQPGEQPVFSGCMVCMAGGIPVWATEDGAFYHWIEDCSGMDNALQIMESEALEKGKQACPACMSVETCVVAEDVGEQSDEVYVWATEYGIYYHSNAYCSGMKGSEYMDLEVAIESGKMRCPNCMNSTVWVSEENLYYHAAAAYQCSGMKDAVSVSEQEALELNRQPCPACLGEENESGAEPEEDGGVWIKENDSLYYHSDAYCASMFTATEARTMGKAACAVCAEDVSDDASVWLNMDKHFHLDKHCSELPGATECSEEEAIESGRTACVLCIEKAVWITEEGEYYHVERYCSGMKKAFGMPVVNALAQGKKPCSICAKQIVEFSAGE